MNYAEYKKIFEEILVLTEKLENLCKEKNFEEIDLFFNKRNELFVKMEAPNEDLTEEQVNYILNLRDKVKEKNDFVLECFKSRKEELKTQLIETKKEKQILDAYTISQNNQKSNYYDFLE